MRLQIAAPLLCGVYLIISGCSHRDDESCLDAIDVGNQTSQVNEDRHDTYYEDLADDDVLIKVGERTLTKSAVDAVVRMQMNLVRLMNPQISSRGEQAFVRRFRGQVISQFKPEALFLSEAEECGIQARPEDLEIQRNDILRVWTNGKFKSFDRLLARLDSCNASVLSNKVSNSALVRSFLFKKGGDSMFVTEDDYKQVEETFLRLQSAARDLDSQQREKANSVCVKLKDGADFDTIRKEFSEYVDEDDADGVWGTFPVDRLPYPQLISFCIAGKQGDISEPIEVEDGICILKLLERQNDNSHSEGVEETSYPVPLVTLARVFIRLPKIYELGSRDEIKLSLENERMSQIQPVLLDELKKKYIISYPNGRIRFSPHERD